MLLGVIDGIWDFFLKLTTNGLGQDLLFYIGVGFIVFMVLFYMLKSRHAYEGRLNRSLEKINRWLYVHQQIDENNLNYLNYSQVIKVLAELNSCSENEIKKDHSHSFGSPLSCRSYLLRRA